jgi:hypothetical protein
MHYNYRVSYCAYAFCALITPVTSVCTSYVSCYVNMITGSVRATVCSHRTLRLFVSNQYAAETSLVHTDRLLLQKRVEPKSEVPQLL